MLDIAPLTCVITGYVIRSVCKDTGPVGGSKKTKQVCMFPEVGAMPGMQALGEQRSPGFSGAELEAGFGKFARRLSR